MFDILSTAELTVSASIAMGFLSLAMARDRARRGSRFCSRSAHGLCWFWRSARPARSAPRGGGAPALGLTVVFPIVALVWAYFALALCADMRWPQRPCRRSSPSMRSVCSGSFRHSLRRGPTSRAVCAQRGLGRCVHRRDRAAARLGGRAIRRPRAAARLLMERARGRRPRRRRPLGALSAPGPLQVFVGPPTAATMTTLPWLIIPGFLVPILFFIHVVIFDRLYGQEPQPPSLRRMAAAGRPAEVGLKQRRRGLRPRRRRSFWRPGKPKSSRRVRNGGAPSSQPARRRPSLRRRLGLTPWGTGPRRNGRRRRSESAS